MQSSNTGQVKVMWLFTGTAGSSIYSPNGDKNSLVLVNLTTADNGDYTPQAMVTSSSLQLSPDWNTVIGQTYRLHVVDIFGELYQTKYAGMHFFILRY